MSQNIWILKGMSMHKQRRRVEATTHILKIKSYDIILDVGCAEGFATNILSRGNQIVGVDVDIDAIRTAQKYADKDNIEFVMASAVKLPFIKKSFNKVTLLEVLEHLPKNIIYMVIEEIDSVLRKERILLISIPYKEKIPYTRCIHCNRLTPLAGHLHSMDEQSVKNFLPSNYILTASLNLPNVGLISLLSIFEIFPFRLWLMLNNLLGKFHKGTWIILKYENRSHF